MKGKGRNQRLVDFDRPVRIEPPAKGSLGR
jgi:hypothetical protein